MTDWDSQVPRTLTPPATGAEVRGDVIHAGYGASIEGASMWDVRLATYEQWITETCNAVPGPMTLAALGAGVGSLLFRRRSRGR